QLVEALTWDRQSSSEDLGAILEELENLDPSSDVDLVIGLVDALPQVSTSFHQLGMARVLGHHLVMRGLNDTAEVKVFDEAFDELGQKERRELYHKRKKHEQTVIFLHEIGHVLGAIHTTDRHLMLYPTYEEVQSRFGAENLQVMRAAVLELFG